MRNHDYQLSDNILERLVDCCSFTFRVLFSGLSPDYVGLGGSHATHQGSGPVTPSAQVASRRNADESSTQKSSSILVRDMLKLQRGPNSELN